MQKADFIIVGAGSAGAALAARLSESGRFSVILLEAGGRAWHPWLHIPIGYGRVFYDARFNWKYQTEPDEGLNGRRSYWPRGKVLGGSSAINAMVYVRGHPGDFDEWATPGWGWRDVEPLFRRLENWLGPPSAERGVGGPLAVSDLSARMHPVSQAFIAAAAEVGVAWNADYNSAEMIGATYYQITAQNGVRASSATAYLKDCSRRKNLRIITEAHATGLRLDGRRATGLTYQRRGKTEHVEAGREIILSAGAINTPQLLQLSGIGPAALLQRLGIDVVVDAPNVGQNLMDHIGVDLEYASRVPSLNQALGSPLGRARAALTYTVFRKGPLAMSLNQAGGFARLSPGQSPPDLQLYFSPLTYRTAPAGKRPLMYPDPFPAFRLGYNQCKPSSRGALQITCADPFAPPSIAPGYLSTEEDRRMAIAGFHLMRKIAAAPSLNAIIERETTPGAGLTDDESVLEFFRTEAGSVFHPCGTCAMGTAPETTVLDERLRVRGLSGLRVADASVFPTIPSGNTNASSIMVGEKASDLILEDTQKGLSI